MEKKLVCIHIRFLTDLPTSCHSGNLCQCTTGEKECLQALFYKFKSR